MHPAEIILSSALAMLLFRSRLRKHEPEKAQAALPANLPLPAHPSTPRVQPASTAPTPVHSSWSLSYSRLEATWALLVLALLPTYIVAVHAGIAMPDGSACLLTIASGHLALAGYCMGKCLARAYPPRNKQQTAVLEGATAQLQHTCLHPNPHISGVWIKEAHRSDSLDIAIEMVQLRGLVRLAINLVKGVEFIITDDGDTSVGWLDMAVFSVISWFKVRESYPLSGAESQCNRRDLRRGKHTGRCEITEGGNINIHLRWSAPHEGHGIDRLRLISTNELHVITTICILDREHTYTTVYRRK